MKSNGHSCKDRGVAKTTKEILVLDGHEVTVSNPEKIYFPKAGITKLELVKYYLAVAEGALRGVARRPMILKRFVNGIEEEPFYQKRAPVKRPDWIDIATFTFPSGRTPTRSPSRRVRSSCTWSTSAAWISTRTRCAPRTWIDRTSCASISIPSPV